MSNSKTSTSTSYDWKMIAASVAAVGAGCGLAYLGYMHVTAATKQKQLREKCLNSIHKQFKEKKDAIIGYIYDASWNDFDRESIQIIYSNFAQLIQNPERGYITHDVFTELANQAGLKDPRVIESLFKMFDEAGDGRLDFMELVEGLDALCCTRTARLKRLFKLTDVHGRGQITRHDLRTLLRAMTGEEETVEATSGPPALSRAKSLNSVETSKIFAFCDDDLSGTLDESEFLQLACNNKIDFMAHGGFFRKFVALFGLNLADYEAHDL